MLWLLIVWNVTVWTVGLHTAHQQDRYARAHFDLTHCSAWSNGTMYCLPKDGCWLLDATGAPACYRVATLVDP